MQDVEMGGAEEPGRGKGTGSVSKEAEEEGKGNGSSSREELVSRPDEREPPPVLTVVISQPEMIAAPKVGLAKSVVVGGEKEGQAVVSKKGFLDRSDSYHEVCRVCQQQTEEVLLDLGCRCRGELAKAHRSCIDIWFRTKGSNKCEICQQIASNVQCPASQPNSTYWVWRVDSARGSNMGRRGCGCFNPLWIAFTILIGGLLLDVLISVSLGVSALPVNIIIGVLIVLGMGTAFRLTLECCHEWSLRRNLMVDVTVNSGYPPTV